MRKLLSNRSIRSLFAAYILLFLVFYGLFVVSFDFVHHFYPPVDPEKLIWWHQQFLFRDGIETWVMLGGMVLYLLTAYNLGKKVAQMKVFSYTAIQLPLLIIAVAVLGSIRSTSFALLAPLQSILLVVLLMAFLFLSYRLHLSRYASVWHLVTVIVLFVSFGGVAILGLQIPSIYDYGYYIGPALKLAQGESFSSFLMQYSLLGVYLFKGMMAFHLKIYQMQVVLATILVAWFGLYFLLARALIREKMLIFLFMLNLVVFRYFAVFHDPVLLPAVLPLRLDLWVPLVLIAHRFGFFSLLTASSFALAYVLDNTFGFIYTVIYGLFLVVRVVFASERVFALKKVGLLFVPLGLSVGFQLITFGSLTNPAGALYQKLQLGFMPIDPRSLFFFILAILPFCVYVLSLEKDRTRKTILFFVMGLLSVQFVYFFGRSHENNLLNISGMWLFALFLALSQFAKLFRKERLSVLLGCVLLVCAVLLFAEPTKVKLMRAFARLVSGQYLEVSKLEQTIDKNPDLFALYPKGQKIFVVSQFDAYINYRYGFKQVGYFTPFPFNLYVDDTVDLLLSVVKEGYRVVMWEDEMIAMIDQLNESEKMRGLSLYFAIVNRGKFYELRLEKGSSGPSVSVSDTWFKHRSILGFSFKYPSGWEVKERGSSVTIAEPKSKFTIAIHEYAQNSATYGKLITQGPADIPSVEKASVRVWDDGGVSKHQFFLTKGNVALELIVYPSTSSLMRVFDKIVNSLEIAQ